MQKHSPWGRKLAMEPWGMGVLPCRNIYFGVSLRLSQDMLSAGHQVFSFEGTGTSTGSSAMRRHA